MFYFATRVRCQLCSCEFYTWFQAETPPEANANYVVECPEQGIRYLLPLSAFKPTKKSPVSRGRSVKAELVTGDADKLPRIGLHVLDATFEPPPPPAPPKRPWWRFWKRR